MKNKIDWIVAGVNTEQSVKGIYLDDSYIGKRFELPCETRRVAREHSKLEKALGSADVAIIRREYQLVSEKVVR